MNFENESLSKTMIDKDKYYNQINKNKKEQIYSFQNPKDELILRKSIKNDFIDNRISDSKIIEKEKNLKKSLDEYIENIRILELRDNELNQIRKDEIKKNSELKTIEEKIENTLNIINSNVPDQIVIEEIKENILENENILSNLSNELQERKMILDDLINNENNEKKNNELESVISRIISENKEIEKKINLIRIRADQFDNKNDNYDNSLIGKKSLQIDRLDEIKSNLTLKQTEYKTKLKRNLNEASEFEPILYNLQENFIETREEAEMKYGLDKSFKKHIIKIQNYIDIIKNEVLSEDSEDLIKKINKKEIKHLISDMNEEDSELDILIIKNELLMSSKQSSINDILPTISSPSNSEKLKNRIKEKMNSSFENCEEELNRIYNIDLDSINYKKSKHSDYASLCDDEKILTKINKKILKLIDYKNDKFEHQLDFMISSIVKNKENLSYIMKDNDRLSLEISDQSDVLNKLLSGEIKPKQETENSMKNVMKIEKMKRSFTGNKLNKTSKIKNSFYEMKKKFLKDVKYQRILEKNIA